MKKAWNGRFEKDLNKLIENFTSGDDILFDQLLIEHDIRGTEAHDIMLNKIGVISDENLKLILKGLEEILEAYNKGKFVLKEEFEDVHLNIENQLLKNLSNEIAGNIHVGRSRNDQILVDMRLYLRVKITEIIDSLIKLIESILNLVPDNVNTLMIAYTHMQPAQPISFGFLLMSYATSLIRDLKRLGQEYAFINSNPLGAAAIAGTSWKIDRNLTMELLNFDSVQINALDVISSRGEFEASLVFSLSMIMNHLNKIAMDFLMWSTKEYNILEFDDSVTTGSSIMPQKKNLDVCELLKAKFGKVSADLLQILNILKGLPSGYNRDTQEIKQPLFDSIKTTQNSIEACSLLFQNFQINTGKITDLLNNSFVTATELIDLIMENTEVDFRTSHKIVGIIIKNLIKNNETLMDLTPEHVKSVLKDLSMKEIEINIRAIKSAIDPFNTIKKRTHLGGPAPSEVLKDYNIKKEKLKTLSKENKLRMEKNELKKLKEIIINNT